MHAHWWDVLVCLLFIIGGWTAILYGVLRQFKVNNPWPVVIASLLVNLGCALLGGSTFLKFICPLG